MLHSASILRTFPQPWMGLFEALSDHSNPLESAHVWYQKNIMSKSWTRVDWNALFCCLSCEKPLDTDGVLTFLPIFLLLPENVQRNVLTFILHHRHEVESGLLADFSGVMLSRVKPDSWTGALLRILNCYVQETDAAVYSFTSHNREKLSALCNKLGTDMTPHCPLWNPPYIQPHHFTDQGNKTVLSTSHTIDPISMETNANTDSIIVEADITMSQSQPGGVSFSTAKESGDEMEDFNLKNDALQLDESLKEQVEDLQRCWTGNVEDPDVPSSIGVLTLLTPEQMSLVCKKADLESLPDGAIATVCHHLSTISETISFANCAIILEHLFLQKLRNLTEGASRLFTTAMLKMAIKFPTQLIDTVLVPCTTSIGQPQIDIVCRLLNETFVPDNKNYFFRKMLSAPVTVDDSMVSLLHVIVVSKIDIDEQTMTKYLTLLEGVSGDMSNNQKFGKLVLLSVQKYGKQMSGSQLTLVVGIAASHQTFLKKTINAAVSKLRK